MNDLERIMEELKPGADACSVPPALDELALIAAIDGEAGADIMAHLRECPYCAERARGFAELQGLLRKQLFRMFCPSSDELAAFQQGRMAASQRATIAQHIIECPHCSREIKLLEHILHEGLVGRSPPWMNGNDNDMDKQRITSTIRRVSAQLIPATTTRSLAGGLRGPTQINQHAYHAENFQLTIGVQPGAHRADRRVVQGALELDNDSWVELGASTAHLLYNDAIIRSAELDELGNFLLDDLAPGTYRLALHLPNCEVIVESLSL